MSPAQYELHNSTGRNWGGLYCLVDFAALPVMIPADESGRTSMMGRGVSGMEYVIAFLAYTVLQWAVLLIVVPIAQKLADFSLPDWPERLWKLAVVAAVVVAVNMLLTPVFFLLGLAGGAIAFYIMMVKWFDIDVFGAIVIVIISRVVAFAISMALLSAISVR
jgi:hypothetical protein